MLSLRHEMHECLLCFLGLAINHCKSRALIQGINVWPFWDNDQEVFTHFHQEASNFMVIFARTKVGGSSVSIFNVSAKLASLTT